MKLPDNLNILFLCSGDGSNELKIIEQLGKTYGCLIFIDKINTDKKIKKGIRKKFKHLTDDIRCYDSFSKVDNDIDLIISCGYQIASSGFTLKEILKDNYVNACELYKLWMKLGNCVPWYKFELNENNILQTNLDERKEGVSVEIVLSAYKLIDKLRETKYFKEIDDEFDNLFTKLEAT